MDRQRLTVSCLWSKVWVAARARNCLHPSFSQVWFHRERRSQFSFQEEHIRDILLNLLYYLNLLWFKV